MLLLHFLFPKKQEPTPHDLRIECYAIEHNDLMIKLFGFFIL